MPHALQTATTTGMVMWLGNPSDHGVVGVCAPQGVSASVVLGDTLMLSLPVGSIDIDRGDLALMSSSRSSSGSPTLGNRSTGCWPKPNAGVLVGVLALENSGEQQTRAFARPRSSAPGGQALANSGKKLRKSQTLVAK